MKKSTLIFLLFSSAIVFAQTTPSFTWNNPVATVSPGQVISMDISYNVGTTNATPPVDNDFFYVTTFLREVNAANVTVQNYPEIYPVEETGGQQPNAQDNVIYDFTVPAGALDTSALPPGNSYILIVFAAYNNATGFVNANTPITLDSTLSIGDFNNKENFTAFYPNPTNSILYFDADVQSENYRIFDMSGRTIIKVQGEQAINVEDLTAGTYFIESDSGIGRFVKI